MDENGVPTPPVPTPPVPPPPPPPPPAGSTEEAETSRYVRMREQYASARTRVDDTVERFEARRADSVAVDAVMSTWERDNATGGDVLAGAMAFRVFMFLIPYVFTVVVGLGFAGDATGQTPHEVARHAGIGGLAALAIAEAGAASTTSRVTVLVIGGFALFLGARSAVKVLMAITALVWQVPIRKAEHLSRSAGAFIVVITLALAVVALLDSFRDTSEPLALAMMVLYTAVPFALWLNVSGHLPHAEGAGWRDLAPGALLVALGAQGLHFFTVLWISHSLASKTETYGAIGAALALLLWAFVLGRILTLSAVLNAAIWYRKHPVGTNVPGPAPTGGLHQQGDVH
jgi:uncharacterized BrkB/YihY/UPF0761 family membrane protein